MLSWIGTISSILGSFVVAFGIMLAGYSLFLIGSISWLIVAIKRKDKALGTLNFAFFVANIIGFYRSIM